MSFPEGNLQTSFKRSRSIGAFTQYSAAWFINRLGYVQCASAVQGKTESSISLKKVDATFGMFRPVKSLNGTRHLFAFTVATDLSDFVTVAMLPTDLSAIGFDPFKIVNSRQIPFKI